MRFDITIRSALKGIPLADAGECGFMSAPLRWVRVGPWWLYQGPDERDVAGVNLILNATPAEGMTDDEFIRAARNVARQLARHAKGVRVISMRREDCHAA